MCAICGCSSPETGEAEHSGAHRHAHQHDHADHHGHSPTPTHRHTHAEHAHETPSDAARTTLSFEQSLLEKNARLAAQNRAWFERRGVTAINLMSSPGAGKTTLLERIIPAVPELALRVIEGDQATANDAERIRRAGARAVQINTGAGCHLDAHAVLHAAEQLEPQPGSLLMIENVGNLVCPALFDLGEAKRVVIFAVTEGDDKPLKYPHMFRTADVVVINKIDLLPHVDCNVERVVAHARTLRPAVRVFPVSATRGDGLDDFTGWLRSVAR